MAIGISDRSISGDQSRPTDQKTAAGLLKSGVSAATGKYAGLCPYVAIGRPLDSLLLDFEGLGPATPEHHLSVPHRSAPEMPVR